MPTSAKLLKDRNGKTINVGSIVRFQQGHRRVTAVFVGSQTVNLGSIFGGGKLVKRVPLADVYEDEEAWSRAWSQSETYMSM